MSNNLSIISGPVKAGPLTVQDDKIFQKERQYFRKNFPSYPLYRNMSYTIPRDFAEVLFERIPYSSISINKNHRDKILNDLPIDNVEDLRKDDIIEFDFSRSDEERINLTISFGKKDNEGNLEMQPHSTFEITNQNDCPLFEYIEENERYILQYDSMISNDSIPLYLKNVQNVTVQNVEDNNIFLYKLFKQIHSEYKMKEIGQVVDSYKNLGSFNFSKKE